MQEVTEWVLHPRESNHAECGGVYISSNLFMLSVIEFIFLAWNIGAKNLNRVQKIELFKQN